MAIPQRDGRQSGKAVIIIGAARRLTSDEACFADATDIPVDGGRSQADHD
ncbi:MAG TPA: hypothetical protein VFF96_07470 [Pseudoxanthomonas sp.]|nr:hypothetical protein [Pseudoxanthomonas sp.]